jgi:hypothetical protein
LLTNAVRSDNKIMLVDIYPVLENIPGACDAKNQLLLRAQYLKNKKISGRRYAIN